MGANDGLSFEPLILYIVWTALGVRDMVELYLTECVILWANVVFEVLK